MAKMLLVDDDPAWRALYRMGFEGDFEVFEAVDGPWQQGPRRRMLRHLHHG